MTDPKVTVCIPSHNHAKFIPEAIESILSQNFTNFELLIIDDHSDDDTRDLVGHYANRDKRIHFKINPINIGMVPNWNLCLAEAKGEFIKPVFSDDLLSSQDALQMMVAQLDADPNISLLGSARNLIDSNSRIIQVLAPLEGIGVQPGETVINRCLYEQKNLIGEPTAVLFRRMDAQRGFLPYYKQIVDLEMWFHLLEKGKYAFINQPLCSFRIHPAQQTEKNANSLTALEDLFHLFDEYMTKPYVTLSALHKSYIRFDNVYKISKMRKAGLISKEQAINTIEAEYGYTQFRLTYPLYKLYKPLLRLRRKLKQRR
ncbi:MAG: glycosyltransferase family A protein [Acidobacteriota bacterium]|jgi:glycosyltransferase involved in cell wall biosynthesis